MQMLGKQDASAFDGPDAVELARHAVEFWITTEDLPSPDNRVTVEPDGRLRVAYSDTNAVAHERLLDKWKSLLETMQCRDEYFEAGHYAGGRNTIEGVSHQNGTVRFGTDPRPRRSTSIARCTTSTTSTWSTRRSSAHRQPSIPRSRSSPTPCAWRTRSTCEFRCRPGVNVLERLDRSAEQHACVDRRTARQTQLARSAHRAALRRSTMSRMAPVPIEECRDPDLRSTLEHFVKTLGFVPNSLLTMQRVPAIAKAVVQLNKAVFDPAGRVDLGLKRLVAHMASYAAGCQYCRAHTTVSATRHGIADEKMAAIYDYPTSPLFDDRERAALDFARDAAAIPNGVTDDSYKELTRHWTDDEIVEILGVVCMFGVFNRWNDSMATPLEAEPIARAGALLGEAGWNVGKHAPSPWSVG